MWNIADYKEKSIYIVQTQPQKRLGTRIGLSCAKRIFQLSGMGTCHRVLISICFILDSQVHYKS